MTVYAITDTKKGRTGIAPTYLYTTPIKQCGCDMEWLELVQAAGWAPFLSALLNNFVCSLIYDFDLIVKLR